MRNKDKPTRITPTSAMIIDNIFTNANVTNTHDSVLLYDNISDHLPIFVGLKSNSTGTADKEKYNIECDCDFYEPHTIVSSSIFPVEVISYGTDLDVDMQCDDDTVSPSVLPVATVDTSEMLQSSDLDEQLNAASKNDCNTNTLCHPGWHDRGQRYNTCYEAISERYMLPDI